MILRPAPDVLPYSGASPARSEGATRLYTIKNFRYIALAEATSFLVLLTSSALKRIPDSPPAGIETVVLVLGALHGGLFVAYVLFALNVRDDAGWTPKQTVLVLVGAVVPFGGFVVDRWLARTGQLNTA